MSSRPWVGHAITVGARRARVVAGIAIAVFVAQGWVLTNHVPVFHEQLALHAAVPSRHMMVVDGKARIVDLCSGDERIVFADGRPSMVLCAGGLAWPVLAAPYIGGVHYWVLQVLRPLHGGDPIAVRRSSLVVGVLGLICLFLLVERVGDTVRAAISVCVAAVLPVVVLIQALGGLYEELPAVLLIAAAIVIARRSDVTVPPTPRRTLLAGVLAGLAVFADVKAAVMALPLLAIALRDSTVLRRMSWRAWGAATLGGALVVAPMMIAALVDPRQRVSHEIGLRFSIAASRIDLRLLATELFHVLVNAADFGYYANVALDRDGDLWPATLAVAAAAFLYAMVSLVRAVRGLPHDRVAAACGGLQLFYVVFVWLAYHQAVATNYAPIALSFAAAFGCAIAALAEWGARRGWSVDVWRVGCSVIVVAILLTNLYRRVDFVVDAATSVNAHAERALAAYLRGRTDRPIAVTSYLLAGVPEAFTGKSAVRLDLALHDCDGKPDEEFCDRRVLVATMDALPGARFLVPLRTTIVDKPYERRMVPLLESAAAETGRALHEEARFTTRTGVPVLALMTADRRDLVTPAAN